MTRQRALNRDKDYGDKGETLARAATFSYHTSGTAKGLLKSETRSPDAAALTHSTAYRYDTFGNRVRATVTARRDGRVAETRCGVRDTAQYDGAGRYVVKERDCLGRLRREWSGQRKLVIRCD